MAELIVTSSLEQIDKYKFCNYEQLRSIIKGINKSNPGNMHKLVINFEKI